jgi:AraC family transcriptional regulator
MAGSEQRRSIPRLSDSQKKNLTDCLSANLTRQLNLTDLAVLFNLSPRQFFRLFCNSFGMTPDHYLLHERVRRAKELLSAGSSPAEVANMVGFANQKHFSEMFKRITGMSPSRFKRDNT